MAPEFAGYRVTSLLRDSPPTAGDGAVFVPPTLWRAVRTADDGDVVLKVFRREDEARARRELDLAEAVHHPHVVPIQGVAVSDDGVALVLPWAAGGSLAALLAHRKRLRWTEVLTVLIPLADALAAAHERGIVHGDVSAANILFDSMGRPLLADMGASRSWTEAGGTVQATPTDVAPEIVRDAVPSAASDMFSLGSVAKHCLTGEPAWPAETFQDVMIQSAAGQWPDVDELVAPESLVAVVRRMLAAEPADRSSAGQATVELRRVGHPEPIELVATAPGGVLGPPPPATAVRPDALNPPVKKIPVRPVRSTWRSRCRAVASRVPVSRLVAVVVAVLIAGGAIRLGWWWAASAGTVPASVATGAQIEPDASVNGQAVDRDRATGVTSRAPATTTSSAATTAIATPGPAELAAPPESDGGVDWVAVVTALDNARAKALTTRDASLLSEVYTEGSPAWEEDAARIEGMDHVGYHVSGARHVVGSVTVETAIGAHTGTPTQVPLTSDGLHPAGIARVRVVQSLPSYEVVRDDGVLLGHTAPRVGIVDIMDLMATEDGYRIVRITEGR